MKAIRPIYDGMDDLDERDWIDYIDMMVCMFSQIQEGIDSMEDISAEQKEELMHKVDLEILPTGVISTEKGINDDMYVAEGVHNGAEASAVFAAMADMEQEQLEEYREHLLRYCELDTYAMVKVWEKLKEI